MPRSPFFTLPNVRARARRAAMTQLLFLFSPKTLIFSHPRVPLFPQSRARGSLIFPDVPCGLSVVDRLFFTTHFLTTRCRCHLPLFFPPPKPNSTPREPFFPSTLTFFPFPFFPAFPLAPRSDTYEQSVVSDTSDSKKRTTRRKRQILIRRGAKMKMCREKGRESEGIHTSVCL